MCTRQALRYALLAAVVVLCAACAGTDTQDDGDARDDQARRQAWTRWVTKGPEHYRFTWYESAMVGTSRILVEVRNGTVLASTPLGDDLRMPEAGRPPTVEDVFAAIRTARSRADEVVASYDDGLGYPVSVSVDVNTDAIDDEYEFGIENLIPA